MSSFLFISRIAESELRGRNLLNIWCSSVIDILAYFWAMLVDLSEILMHAQREIEHSIAVIELPKPLVENSHAFFFYLFLRFSLNKVGSQTLCHKSRTNNYVGMLLHFVGLFLSL